MKGRERTNQKAKTKGKEAVSHGGIAIEEVMVDVARGDDWEVATSEANWIDALALTQFTDHMRLISAAVKPKRPPKSK